MEHPWQGDCRAPPWEEAWAAPCQTQPIWEMAKKHWIKHDWGKKGQEAALQTPRWKKKEGMSCSRCQWRFPFRAQEREGIARHAFDRSPRAPSLFQRTAAMVRPHSGTGAKHKEEGEAERNRYGLPTTTHIPHPPEPLGAEGKARNEEVRWFNSFSFFSLFSFSTPKLISVGQKMNFLQVCFAHDAKWSACL